MKVQLKMITFSSCFYVGDSHHIATSLTSISNKIFIFVIFLSPLSTGSLMIQFPICLPSLLSYLSDLHWLYLTSCLEILPIIILFYYQMFHLFSPEQVHFLTLRKFNFGMFNNNINRCLKIIYFRMVVVEGCQNSLSHSVFLPGSFVFGISVFLQEASIHISI